mgnify:CR=1 FL=1
MRNLILYSYLLNDRILSAVEQMELSLQIQWFAKCICYLFCVIGVIYLTGL